MGTAVDREKEYRLKLMRQFLDGEVHFDDHGVAGADNMEGWRRDWLAPQCAVLQWYLDHLRTHHGLGADRLQPFLEVGGFSAHLSGFLSTTHKMKGICSDIDGAVPRRFADACYPQLGMNADTLEFATVNAEAIPHPDGVFRFVFAFSTIHHFEDPLRCLREIRRVLAPGGVFLCAWEPLQPLLRRDRHPCDRSEVKEGLVENVFSLHDWDAMVREVFPRFESVPLCDVRGPAFVQPVLKALPRNARRVVANLVGGVDYSAIGFKD